MTQQPPTTPYPRPSNPQAVRHVLLCDDEPRLRDMMNRAVTDMGFIVATAGSAEAALRHLAQSPVDIIVLDLNLPGMHGLDALATISEKWPDVAVIVLTGFGDLDAARKAIHYNVVEFLTKPCPLGQLEVALDRARHRRAGSGMTAPAAAPAGEPAGEESKVPAPPATASLEDVERQHILAALERHQGNRAGAAAELGISVRKLYYRLEQYEKEGHIVREK